MAEFIIKSDDKKNANREIILAFNEDKPLIENLHFLDREVYQSTSELWTGIIKYEGNIEFDDLVKLTSNHVSVQIPNSITIDFSDLDTTIDVITGESFFIFVYKELQLRYKKNNFTQISGPPQDIHDFLKDKVKAYLDSKKALEEENKRIDEQRQLNRLKEKNNLIKDIQDRINELNDLLQKLSSDQIDINDAEEIFYNVSEPI